MLLAAETTAATTPENAIGLPSVVPSAETTKSEVERQESEAIADMFSPTSPRAIVKPVADKKPLVNQRAKAHIESHGKSIEQIMKSKEDSDAATTKGTLLLYYVRCC